MRFRTRITNIALLHKIARSLAAIAKTCTIHLSPEKVCFIVPGNEGRDGVQVWSQVNVDTLFGDSYRIESNNENAIWLEIQLEAFLKVLRSADSSAGSSGENARNATSLRQSDVTLKLNKKGSQAIWVFDIKGISPNGRPMMIAHEVNVKVLSLKRQKELQEPLCPPPDIHLVLPNLIELKNIVSRLGSLASDVIISANHEGTLRLTVESGKVDLSMEWKNMHIPQNNAAADEDPPPKDKFFECAVAIKGLQKFLTSYLVGSVAIACICEKHCVIAYVYIGEMHEAGGVLTFFIPAKLTGDD